MYKYSKMVDRIAKEGIKYAIVDVDNTITKSNVLDLFLFLQKKRLKSLYKLWAVFFCLTKVPIYLLLDFFNRELFQKAFYKNYNKYTLNDLNKGGRELFNEILKNRFIQDIHDLIFYLKDKGIEVILLSTSIEPVIKEYGKYFNIKYKCLEVFESGGRAFVDLTHLKNFKENYIKMFNKDEIISIADSKHDKKVLMYSKYAIIVNKRTKKWMDKINCLVMIRDG